MKYKICWFEFTDRTGDELKDFLETLPNPVIKGQDCFDESRLAIECTDTFEAKNIKEAIKLVGETYCDVEIFTALDAKTGKRLFTEEDLI